MTTAALAARTRNVATWEMTREELARTWAAQHGVTARVGGWIYDAKGRAVCQGWAGLADYLVGAGVIAVGSGIDWRRTAQRGVTMLLAGVRQAAADGRVAARRTR